MTTSEYTMNDKENSNKVKILVVDDQEANLFLLENLLTDYKIIAAESAEEMWHLLKVESPDLILLDVMLPGEDGLRIAQRLSDNRDFSKIPVIFVTARDEGEHVAAGFESGGYDYIKKPFDNIELKARIKAVLRKKMVEEELRRQSITDPLTGIYNRRYFLDTANKNLNYAIRHQNDLALAILDIDWFKKINDKYGHLTGDFVLKEFALLIKGQIREYDTLARYGGEEFVVMLPGCDKRVARIIVERAREELRGMVFHYDNEDIRFTFSAGVADISELEKDEASECLIAALIKIADFRLYRAKGNGRDLVVIDDE